MVNERISVVTGGASGIGRATAARLAAAGDRVIVADLSEEAGSTVVEAIRKGGGRAEFRRVDVAADASVDELARRRGKRISVPSTCS